MKMKLWDSAWIVMLKGLFLKEISWHTGRMVVLHRLDDCQKFFPSHAIVSFYLAHAFTEVVHNDFFFIMNLRKDCSYINLSSIYS